MNIENLFLAPTPKKKAQLRLVCFSYAGGSSATYLPWETRLHPGVELVVCQLPGRGTRLFEEPYDKIDLLISDLVTAITPLCDIPLIFFGHSMGSKIAYELCLAMQMQQLPLPIHFIASASAAPFIERHKAPIHDLAEADFIAALARLNGTPQQVLDNQELMALFLPALRADFKLVETYLNTSRTRLPTRLTLMGGINDSVVSATELSDWTLLFTKPTDIHWFEGDHFYLNHETTLLLDKLNNIFGSEIVREQKPITTLSVT